MVLAGMAAPGEADLARLKRLLRYLKGRPEAPITIPYGQDLSTLTVQVDSDFAGCKSTRRSTCGGIAYWGGGVIKSWSKTLPTLALSTGEAELGALVKGVAEGEGLVSLLKDFDFDVTLCVESDAAAAIGITRRLGLGRVRHLAVSDLWIQQKVRQGSVVVEKVPGTRNTSDMCTKALDGTRLEELMKRAGLIRHGNDDEPTKSG